ncbi:uncharacterized protein LOC101861642 [Aplysia californica]|uniref:Uncharacterized protein LOC101861642 n=1 Tax=Aplysia californica TaxID=6500 RepID=A0ABM0JEL1_APLCA|nr:uncharacterized protein LOC101861642 [Aplysia californica]
MGFRCPFPPNEDGSYPDACYDVMDQKCNCLLDDMVLTMFQCGNDLFGRLVQIQLDLEVERNDKRIELGEEADPEPYQAILQCKEQGDRLREGVLIPIIQD